MKYKLKSLLTGKLGGEAAPVFGKTGQGILVNFTGSWLYA